MKWYPRLYTGDSVRGKAKLIKFKIEHGPVPQMGCLVTLANNPANLMEIIPIKELKNKSYPRENLRVIGIAGDQDEALSIVTRVIEETWAAFGNTDIRRYLSGKAREWTG